MGLATASLGFEITLATENKLAGCWAMRLLVVSLAALLASAGVGIWCELNRLKDFRKTAEVARRREQGEHDPADEKLGDREFNNLRREAERLGNRTWILFYVQVATFGAEILALMGSFVAAYHARLF